MSTGHIDIQDELTSFVWSIELSNIINAKTSTSLYSPLFLTPSHYNRTAQWKLQLYPHGISQKHSGYLSLYLCRQAAESSFTQRAAYFAIINSADEEINSFYLNMCGNSRGILNKIFSKPSWGIDRFLEKSCLSVDLNTILKNNKLTILCCIANVKSMNKLFKSFEFMDRPTPLPRTQSKFFIPDDDSEYAFRDGEFSESEKSHASSSNNLNEEEKNSSDIIDEFEEMLVTGKSDVTLMARDKIFYAHRVILSSQSSVFRDIFEKDKLSDIEVSTIDATDLTGNVLKEVLRSIYTGEANDIENKAHEILGPANKYALTELKSISEDIMIENLSIENASNYLVLSFMHDADKVRTRAMEYIVENSKNIMKTSSFKEMAGSHANVIAAIFSALSIKD